MAGRVIGAIAERGAAARAHRGPRRARPRLHPRDAAAAVDAREPLLPRRGARPPEHPGGGPGAAGGQPLGRQPHARHARLHARVQHLLRRRAALPPARPQPRAVDAGPRHACASTARSRRRPRTPQRALDVGAALLVYPGGDYEVHRPSWESAKVDFGGRKGFIRLAPRSARCRSCRWWRSAARRPRCSSRAASGSRRLLGLDRMFRLKVLPISLALPWGLNVGDMLGHIPLPAKITIQVLEPIDVLAAWTSDRVYERVIDRDADGAHRPRRGALAAGDRLMRVERDIAIDAPPRARSGSSSPIPTTTTRFWHGITRCERRNDEGAGSGARFTMRMQSARPTSAGWSRSSSATRTRDMAWTSITGIDQRVPLAAARGRTTGARG